MVLTVSFELSHALTSGMGVLLQPKRQRDEHHTHDHRIGADDPNQRERARTRSQHHADTEQHRDDAASTGRRPQLRHHAAQPLPSLSSAFRTSLNSSSDALSALGNFRSSFSSTPTMAEPITTRANHLWSAGTTCHGASAVEVCLTMS